MKTGIHSWPLWPLQMLLSVLFLGPLIAPLFQATHLPFIADSGALARNVLSHYVCPTPAKSFIVLGFPMAVCARCWGATIGLWIGWFLFRRPILGLYLSLPWFTRLCVAALPFLLWSLEIRYWLAAPLIVLIFNGMQAGFWAGLFLYSIWPSHVSKPTWTQAVSR